MSSFLNTIATTLLILGLICCTDPACENLSVFKAFDGNLKKTNKEIIDNTNAMIQRFRLYSNDPMVSSKSNPLLDYMLLISRLSNVADSQIQSVRLNFEKQILTEKKEAYDNSKKVINYFEKEKHAAEIFKILVNYQNSIWQVHPDLYNFLRRPNYFFDSFSTSGEVDANTFTQIYFSNIPAVAAETMLTKFQNDIISYENRAVRFFFDKLAYDKSVFIK